jgi:hypothetical protein
MSEEESNGMIEEGMQIGIIPWSSVLNLDLSM